ncbi:MAG: hypothetical protein WCI49_09290 [Ferruginibacter sp.]
MISMLLNKIKSIVALLAVGLVIVLLSATGCYYDKEEKLYPQTVCDTATVTYSSSVVPILLSNCTICHGGNTPSAGIKLDTYAGVKVQADNGRLWGAVSQATSFSPMPKNGTKLSTCNLTKIKKWLDAGALNN